jgi:cell division inhibitor SulA
MNPILHELEAKQWIWTAASENQTSSQSNRITTGYEALDEALSGGFPESGMIHVNSHLGCGELRLMLSVLQQRTRTEGEFQCDSLTVFIAPPFMLNAEFLLNENVALEHLLVISPADQQEALWSAEQCAKSGVCDAIFLWRSNLTQTQIRKLELAALHGNCHCFWFDNSQSLTSNLPLSLSLSLIRENESIQVKVNKQKVGWAKPAVSVKVPFKCRVGSVFQSERRTINNVVQFNAAP